MKTSFRIRKNKQLRLEKTYKILTFKLQDLYFGLPLQKIIKVIIGNDDQWDDLSGELKTITYQGQSVTVVDGNHYIFNRGNINQPINIENKHLLLFMNYHQQKIMALPVDSIPRMLEAKRSEFKKLPPQCDNIGNISLFSNKVVQQRNNPLYIIFSPEKMLLND